MYTRVLVTGFVVGVTALFAGCSLNPQPEPPGTTADLGAPTGAGGTATGGGSSGKGGAQAMGAGAGGASAGAAGDGKNTGGGFGVGGKAGKGGGSGAAGASTGGGAGPGAGGSGSSGASGAGVGGSGNSGNGGTGVSAGAGGGGGQVGTGPGGGGGGAGGPAADTPIASLAPAVPATCKQCLESMSGSPAANAGLDCGGVVAACGAKDQACGTAVGCIASSLGAHPGEKFDCAVAKCDMQVGGEPAAKDFLACLADKCGSSCDATIGFADTAACPP